MSPTQRAYTIMRPASQDEQDVAENWRTRAACIDADPDIFFQEHTAYARKICAGCPVREICLQDAVAVGDFYGVRGGHTGRQRWFISRGEDPLSPAVTNANIERISKGARTRAAILELAQAGLGSREISGRLDMPISTVRNNLRKLRERGEL